jgi:hypothetical protein
VLTTSNREEEDADDSVLIKTNGIYCVRECVDDCVLTTSNGEEEEDADEGVLVTINEVNKIMLMILCLPQAIL